MVKNKRLFIRLKFTNKKKHAKLLVGFGKFIDIMYPEKAADFLADFVSDTANFFKSSPTR